MRKIISTALIAVFSCATTLVLAGCDDKKSIEAPLPNYTHHEPREM